MSEIINKMKSIKWQRVLFIFMILAVVAGGEGCKSTGKLSKKERKAQIEAAKRELNAIIAGTSTKTLEQQDSYINEITNKNYNDPELNELLLKASQKMKRAWAEREKQRQERIDQARAELLDLLQNKDNKNADQLEAALSSFKAKNKDLGTIEEFTDLYNRIEKKIAEMRTPSEGSLPIKTRLENNFQGIVEAGKSGDQNKATTLMKNTLSLFSSEDAPVLIIIFKEGSTVDYDKPTTIKRYLNFILDIKRNPNAVDSYLVDDNGKIKELDLITKKY
ncbi:MAG: hypothetical protein WCL00_08950 [Bacteroidota bacterium]